MMQQNIYQKAAPGNIALSVRPFVTQDGNKVKITT